MKSIQALLMLVLLTGLISCDSMESNYEAYLDEEINYSPKVQNLRADVGLRTATLHWENPRGDIAKQILIKYDQDSLLFESMVDSATLTNLEIKVYQVHVHTIDDFGNYSVPESLQLFPNGENE